MTDEEKLPLHPVDSFIKFMQERYPGACEVCLGEGKIQFIGPMTRQILEIPCKECNMTGRKP